jgi:hypothetical protein
MAEFCLAVAAYAYLLESVPLRQTIVRQGGVDIIAMVGMRSLSMTSSNPFAASWDVYEHQQIRKAWARFVSPVRIRYWSELRAGVDQGCLCI